MTIQAQAHRKATKRGRSIRAASQFDAQLAAPTDNDLEQTPDPAWLPEPIEEFDADDDVVRTFVFGDGRSDE